LSACVRQPLAKVWHLIKLQDFSSWWSALESSSTASGSDEADVYTWKFKDGTELTIKQEEHSSIDHSITFSIIGSSHSLSYTSSLSKITVSPVTSGAHANSSFVTWSGNFSSDADANAIEDARFKRQEALADLAKAVSA
jgi:hypothetical protein